MSFLDPIAPFLGDPTVSEVMINGPSHIYVERRGRIFRTGASFADIDALLASLRNLAQFVGRPLSKEHPILEARLPDGSRVEAILPPASPDGPSVAIRKFSSAKLSLDELCESSSLSQESSLFLQEAVRAKKNILVAGGTGSGKTSLLNVLSSCISEDERLVVLEDSRELQLRQPHVVQLEVQPGDAKGRGAVSLRQLFRATLRMRPDRIIMGEIRGTEALDLIQSMISGHGGTLSTIHATHPHDTLYRLETLAMASDIALPLEALRKQIASAVDLLVQVERLPTGARCTTEIAECVGCRNDGSFELRTLFGRDERSIDSPLRRISEL